MERRQFLAAAGVLGAGATAGCTGLFGSDGSGGNAGSDESGGEPPLVEDRPNAVYYPTHREGMEMIGMGNAGDVRVGLTYSYPHRFWTTDGGDTQRVAVREGDGVHLMATLWDDETDTVLSVDTGLAMTIERDGEVVSTKDPWTMLSQNMGFHYGDNYRLDGDGTYTVTVRPGSVDARLLGAFHGKFESPGAVEIEFRYDEAAKNSIPYETVEKRGRKGALDLMSMNETPTSTVPPRNDLPGTVVGEGESGDARFVATVIDDPSFVDAPAYLAVSARTPYNLIPIPMMGLSARIERNGEAAYDDALAESLHPELGHHYGVGVERVESGDAVSIAVDAQPQFSRHEGYETAFLEMSTVEFTAER